MYHKMLTGSALCVLFGALLTGCATAPPTENCAAWMMVKPRPIADVKPGDDIIEKYAELRSDAGKDKSKVRGLQACAKAMTGH